MAIEVDGVSLPDIPEDVLTQNPYATIFATKDAPDIDILYVLLVSCSPQAHLDASLLGETGGGIVCYAPATEYIWASGQTEWTLFKSISEEEKVFAQEEVPNTDGGYIELIWANHDVYYVISVDTNGYDFTVGYDTYFRDSTVSFEVGYEESGEWFRSMAEQTRRLARSTQRYTTDGMLEALKAVEAGSELTDAMEVIL